MGRPELQYHFGVIDTELVNAYATPGGYVFVSFGALKLMENEAQLVGVIAHEIAHIDLRHEVKKLKIRALEDSYSTEISAILGSTSATKRVLFEQMTGKAMKILFEEGRSKEMEVEADLQGIRTMMELGYDWKSYINYLEKLDHLMGDASTEISKTHPTSHERVAAIEKLVADQKFFSKPGKKNQKRFEANVRL